MDEYIIEEYLWKELKKEYLDFMIESRIEEYWKNNKNFEKDDKESRFFFLKQNEKILAFWVLRNITLLYDSIEYNIKWLWAVLAITKSSGHWSKLIWYIHRYLKDNNFACIWNTKEKNFDFYRKFWFKIKDTLLDRFMRIDWRKEVVKDWNGHKMFFYDPKNKIKKVIEGKQKIIIHVPIW